MIAAAYIFAKGVGRAVMPQRILVEDGCGENGASGGV
jgi:hypothetical protein